MLSEFRSRGLPLSCNLTRTSLMIESFPITSILVEKLFAEVNSIAAEDTKENLPPKTRVQKTSK